MPLALPVEPDEGVCELTVKMENEETAEGKRVSKKQNVKYVQRERSTSKKRYASPGTEIVERGNPAESGKLGSSPRTVTNKIMIETSKNGEENKNTFSINMNLHMNSNNSMPLNPTTNQTSTTIRTAPSSLENAKKIISQGVPLEKTSDETAPNASPYPPQKPEWGRAQSYDFRPHDQQ